MVCLSVTVYKIVPVYFGQCLELVQFLFDTVSAAVVYMVVLIPGNVFVKFLFLSMPKVTSFIS